MFYVIGAAALLLPLFMPNGGTLGLLLAGAVGAAAVAFFASTNAEGVLLTEFVIAVPFAVGVVAKGVWLLILRARREMAEEKRGPTELPPH